MSQEEGSQQHIIFFCEEQGSLVFRTIAVSFSTVLVLILGRIFWRLRTHFLIASRFPKTTLLAVALLGCMSIYDVATNHIICAGLYSVNFWAMLVYAIAHTLPFAFASVIVYRTYLVFHKWRMADFRLRYLPQMLSSSVTLSSDAAANHLFVVALETYQNVSFCNRKIRILKNRFYRYLRLTIFILSALITVSIVLMLTTNHAFIYFQQTLFTMLVICGVYVMVKARRVSESMLCLRETLLVVICIVIMTALGISSSFADIRGILRIIGTITGVILCVFMLGLPLLMVYKSEGTLNTNVILQQKTRLHYNAFSSISLTNTAVNDDEDSAMKGAEDMRRDADGSNSKPPPSTNRVPGREKQKENEHENENESDMKTELTHTVDSAVSDTTADGSRTQQIGLTHDKDRKEERKISRAFKDMLTLPRYLHSESHYQEFAAFLAQCFTLEHLLYFVRVVIFRQILLSKLKVQLKQRDSGIAESGYNGGSIDADTGLGTDNIRISMNNVDDDGGSTHGHSQKKDIKDRTSPSPNTVAVAAAAMPMAAHPFVDKWCGGGSGSGGTMLQCVYSLDFSYIVKAEDIYELNVNMDDAIFRLKMSEIALDIFCNFVAPAAVNEINICSQGRSDLIKFFTTNNGHGSGDGNGSGDANTHSIESYLEVFNASMVEVYILLNCVYRFKYSSDSRFSK